MPEINLLTFFTSFFAGILAGFEIAVHYGIGAPPDSLTESAQILLRQALIRRLRILAPALFCPTLALGIAVAVRDRTESGILLHEVALCALALWIAIRALRTVPVNIATLEWRPEAPPTNWRSLVEKTERFHVIAAWASVVAFGCFLWSALQP
jgi:hypothetical protein